MIKTMNNTNPYDILGVPKGTTLDECKKIARQLLKKYHPDNNGDAIMFQKVQEAMKEIEINGDKYKPHLHLTHITLFTFEPSNTM